jgi:hypothetical protein
MKPFFSVEQALEHVVKTLIPQQHNYIVNILGPDAAEAREDATPQVTSHHLDFQDGDVGLTVALPFGPEAPEFARLATACALDAQRMVSEHLLDGAPHYFVNFGQDAATAARAVHYLLEHVHGFAPGTSFVCVVHDEGPL